MTALQYVGLGFAAILVIFLIIAYFARENINSNQFVILRFLCSLCGGFAGGLITGSALFDLHQKWSGGTLAVSGTAGFALFFVVWYGFTRVTPRPRDSFNMSIPDGWSFKDAATAIVQHDKSVVSFEGFLELAARLSSQVLKTDTVTSALIALRALTPSGSVRPYRVDFSTPTYTLTITA
jgi:hypothetical protein